MIEIPLIRDRTENILTSVDAHNTFLEQYIDLNGVMPGVRHSYSQYDNLVKYSHTIHSPISSKPSNALYLGTPNSYGDLSASGLVRDDSEGILKEKLNWKEQGSKQMEKFKRVFTQISPEVYEIVKLELTWLLPDHYVLFCASIDPMLNHERRKQMLLTNSCYDFMTIIKNPAFFAKQLGVSVRKQLNTLSTIVYHGPVIYLDENKINEFANRCHKRLCNYESFPDFLPIAEHEIRLFLKEKKYEVQQEYRFVVYTPNYRHRKSNLKLNVSDDLRKLMFPAV